MNHGDDRQQYQAKHEGTSWMRSNSISRMPLACPRKTPPRGTGVLSKLTRREFKEFSLHSNLRWTEASRVCAEAIHWPGELLPAGARQPCLESDARNSVLPPWGERSRLIRANQDAKHSIGRGREPCPQRYLHQTELPRIAHNPSCNGRQSGRRMSRLSNLASIKKMMMFRHGSRSVSQ